MRNQSRGFTLIEVLVVIGIIGILMAMLFPLLVQSQEEADKVSTLELVQGLQQAMKLEKSIGRGYPYPEHLVPPSTEAAKRVGFFLYDPTEKKPGLINRFVDGQGYSFDHGKFTNEQGQVVDAWGNPIHYVLGDYKNNERKKDYDPDLPKDLNKPKDADKPAKDTDWNSKDLGRYAYIYSEGPNLDPDTWIYYKE